MASIGVISRFIFQTNLQSEKRQFCYFFQTGCLVALPRREFDLHQPTIFERLDIGSVSDSAANTVVAAFAGLAKGDPSETDETVKHLGTGACHSERSEESRIICCANLLKNTQRCLKAWPHASHFVGAPRST
jgi:hypothetical protein